MTIPAGSDSEITFISGITSNATVAGTSFWSWNGNKPATYSSTQSWATKWGSTTLSTSGTPGGTVTYWFDTTSNWSTTEKNALLSGLALWSDIANISFSLAASASAANFTFFRGHDGSAYQDFPGETTPSTVGSGSEVGPGSGALISIDTRVAGFGPIGGAFSLYGGYPYQTLVHEEGHILGLGHGGPYNGTVNSSTQQFSVYDTRLWSVMSYINPFDTSAKYYNSYPVTGTDWGISPDGYYYEPTTPMMLDILAAQRIYGAATSGPLASGGQIFGFHSNISGLSARYFDFTVNTHPVITIWDGGTHNTLDLSGFSANATISLIAGTFSSAAGAVNNIAIAEDTIIETAIGGSGNDIIIGSSSDNTLDGGPGANTLTGGAGADAFVVGASALTPVQAGTSIVDHILDYNFSQGDTLDFSALLSAAYGSGQAANSLVRVLEDASGTTAILQIDRDGTASNADWTTVARLDGMHPGDSVNVILDSSGQASTTLTAPALVATHNFDGNSTSDILWRNDGGSTAIWEMNGPNIVSGINTNRQVGNDWHISGIGDFNGDGNSDILWRNDGGATAIWEMNGQNVTVGINTSRQVGNDWQIAGIGDFNGDGKSDILWRSTGGATAIWDMDGPNVTVGINTSRQVGNDWHIAGIADFNGDGRSDILWRSDGGATAIWQMNGPNVEAGINTSRQVGNDWHIAGIGDFDGDGKADILWRNDGGATAIWEMNGANVTVGINTSRQVGNDWHIAGISDYNGDGKSDILWRSDSGATAIWEMNGANVIVGINTSQQVGNDWHVV
jgi:serralysin